MHSHSKRSPAAAWPPGFVSSRRSGGAPVVLLEWVISTHNRRPAGRWSFQRLPPVEGMGPSPGVARLIQQISRSNEVVGRRRVIRRVGYDATPSLATSMHFYCTHQAQLKGASPMLAQDSDAAEIASILRVRRGYNACKAYRLTFLESQPPMTGVEFRNGRAMIKRPTMKFSRVSATSSSSSYTFRIRYVLRPQPSQSDDFVGPQPELGRSPITGRA